MKTFLFDYTFESNCSLNTFVSGLLSAHSRVFSHEAASASGLLPCADGPLHCPAGPAQTGHPESVLSPPSQRLLLALWRHHRFRLLLQSIRCSAPFWTTPVLRKLMSLTFGFSFGWNERGNSLLCPADWKKWQELKEWITFLFLNRGSDVSVQQGALWVSERACEASSKCRGRSHQFCSPLPGISE